MLVELECGVEVSVSPNKDQLYYCPQHRVTTKAKPQNSRKQFKARIEPGENNPSIHAIEIFFEADHIMDAFDLVRDFAKSNSFENKEITKVVDITSG